MGSLAGKTILVTRPAEESESLAERLREERARAIEAPAIEIAPLEDTSELDSAVASLAAGEFSWVAFSSPRAVAAVGDRLAARGLEFPRAQRVAVVGPATANRLNDLGVTPHLVADPHTTDALAEAFPPGPGRVLLPRADIAPDGLEERLSQKGWTPVRVEAYRTRFLDTLPEEAARALDAGDVDAIAFTSASTVQGFVHMAGGVPDGVPAVCIGPVAAEAARRAGFHVAAVADPHTIDGLAAALARTLGGG